VQRLIELVRAEQGDLSLGEYARELGVGISTLSRFYNGHHRAPWAVVIGFLRRHGSARCGDVCDILASLPGDARRKDMLSE
jgi:hypothetical protein